MVDPGEPATDGNNVRLTLNAAYQEVAERVIRDNVATVRSLEEDKIHEGKWLEKYKAEIHARKWDQFPLELAQHGFGVDAYFGVAALGHVIGFLY